MNTCETCVYWTENTGWNDMVSKPWPYPGPSEDDPQVKAFRQHNRESGLCEKINEGWMWDGEPEPLPLATVWDGSEYKATLHTHKSFGCVLHHQKGPV